MTDGPPKSRIRLTTENVGNVPEELRARKQWVNWRLEVRGGKPTKVPRQPDGQPADSTDPKTWSSFEDVLAAYETGGFDGIGFVFSKDGPYCGIDIDGGRDCDGGELAPWAKEIVEALGSYSEVSPSGKGVKVFCMARKPGPKCKKPYADGHVEIYDADRYFTVTGATLDVTPRTVETRQEAVDALYQKVFGAKEPTPATPMPPPPQDAADDGESLSDERIIDLACDRRRRKGAGEKFAALWAGQWHEFFGSASEADASLIFRLAYYTKDPVQLDRLFRKSGLMREKWDERRGSGTYGQGTIRQALETVTAQYRPRKPVSAAATSTHVENASPLPEVLLPGGAVPITEAGTKLGSLLAATEHYYVRGGAVVALENDDEKLPILQPIKPASLTSILEGVAVLTKLAKQGAAFVEVPTTCSEQTAKLLMHAAAFLSELPPIRVLTHCPVLIERDGRLIQISGYDRESGILAAGNPAPEVPLDDAVEMLYGMLSDFRFATPSDLSRALAAVITPALVFGGLLNSRAPVDLGEADQSQTGKGYRNKLTASVYRSTVKTITQRKGGVGGIEETFCSALLAGHCIVSFDNIRGALDCQSLESFLTEDRFEARTPHLASVEIDPRRVIVQMTSNKAEVTPDLANRASCVRILKQEPGYKFRKFAEGDLLDHVRANQPGYLGAVFSVIRAWYAAGKPRSAECEHDFRPWAQTLGWIVENVLHAAPLLRGHRETQVRIANPNLNWLRDVALAVRRAGCLDQPLRAGYLSDILADAPDVETPGLPEGGDLSDEAARKSVLQSLGRKLSLCFGGEADVRIDDMVVTRRESTDGLGRSVKDYVFRIDVTPTRYEIEAHSGDIGGSIGENACRNLGQNGAQLATASSAMNPLCEAVSSRYAKPAFPLCSANPSNDSGDGKHTVNVPQSSGNIENTGTLSGIGDDKTVKSRDADREWTQV